MKISDLDGYLWQLRYQFHRRILKFGLVRDAEDVESWHSALRFRLMLQVKMTNGDCAVHRLA